MNMKSRVAINIVLILVLPIGTVLTDKCPNIPAMKDLDIKKLMETDIWYIQYHDSEDAFHRFRGSKCVQTTVSVTKNLDQETFYQTTKTVSVQTGRPSFFVYRTKYNSETGHLTLNIENDSVSWGPVDETVILTDHISFTVSVICAKDKSNPDKIYKSVRISTTCADVPPIDLKEIHNLLEKYDIDVKFERVNRKNCVCEKL